jgi:hypothetical protein
MHFRKDDYENLICREPTPSCQPILHNPHSSMPFPPSTICSRKIYRGEPDPGRRLFQVRRSLFSHPMNLYSFQGQLSYEFEYIPIYYPRPLTFLHHPSGHDNTFVIFDTTDNTVCPLLHFRASHFALLAEAASRIGIPES